MVIGAANVQDPEKVANEFDEFCILFGIPPECPGLINTIDNLFLILAEHRAVFDRGMGTRVPQLHSVIGMLLDNRHAILAVDADVSIPTDRVDEKLLNFYGAHPLYTMLFHSTCVDANLSSYHLLQAYAIVSFIRLEPDLGEHRNNVLIEFARAVRALGEAAYAKTIQSLPDDEYDAKNFVRHLRGASNPFLAGSKQYRGLKTKIACVANFLAGNAGNESISRRRSGSSNHNKDDWVGIRGVRSQPDLSTITVYDPKTGIKVITETAREPTRVARDRRLGIPPTDTASQPNFLSSSGSELTHFYTIGDFVTSLRRRTPAISRTMAALPWARHETSAVNIQTLFRLLIEPTTSSQSLSPRIALIIGLTLRTGRSLESRESLCILSEIGKRNLDHISVPTLILADACIVLPTAFEVHRRNSRKEWYGFSRPHAGFIVLPAPDFLLDHARAVQRKSTDVATQQYRSTKRFLKELNRRSGTNLTIGKLQRFLPDYICSHHCHDWVDASYVAGRPIEPVTAALDYTGLSLTYINKFYSLILTEIAECLQLPALAVEFDKVELLLSQSCAPDTTCGSLIVPRTQSFAKCLYRLRQDIMSLRTPKTIEQLACRHNLYVLYVVRLIDLCTAFRSVTNPFPTMDEVDLKTGYAAISDKDSQGFPDARLVWLPEHCRRQIHCFLLYREHLAENLTPINRGLLDNMRKQPNQQPLPASRHRWQAHRLNCPTTFFLLDASGQPTDQVTVEMMEQLSKEYFPLPLNHNRHFLATTLRENHATRWLINYLLGHWHFGQQPGERYSSFSPNIYRDLLAPQLDQLIQQLGWEILEL